MRAIQAQFGTSSTHLLAPENETNQARQGRKSSSMFLHLAHHTQQGIHSFSLFSLPEVPFRVKAAMQQALASQ
jgi:hypothetical protein